MTYSWRETTLADALQWAAGKAMVGPYEGEGGWPGGCRSSPSGVVFSDGSVVACSSDWSGPYSELTPDVDGEPPRFWIGTSRHAT